MTMRSVLLAAATLLLALPASAGIHFLPGATADEAVTDHPTRMMPAWQLATGVLVVDRRPEAERAPMPGRELTPRHQASDFFLVGGRHEDVRLRLELRHRRRHAEADRQTV
jgi:hypothetical protein